MTSKCVIVPEFLQAVLPLTWMQLCTLEAVREKVNNASAQWCIAKNGGGYMQWGVAKGLKVPCLFMITEVSIRCQKNARRLVYAVYPRILPNTPLPLLITLSCNGPPCFFLFFACTRMDTLRKVLFWWVLAIKCQCLSAAVDTTFGLIHHATAS